MPIRLPYLAWLSNLLSDQKQNMQGITPVGGAPTAPVAPTGADVLRPPFVMPSGAPTPAPTSAPTPAPEPKAQVPKMLTRPIGTAGTPATRELNSFNLQKLEVPGMPESYTYTKPAPLGEIIGGYLQHKVGPALASPTGQAILGQLAQAISAKVPESWQYQLASQITSNAKGRALQDVARGIAEGKPLSEIPGVAILSPEESAQAIQLGQQALRDKATASYQEAIASGVETPEQKAKREQENIALKYFYDATQTSPRDWIDWGWGQKKNVRTGEIVKVPTPPTGQSSEQTQYRLWYNQAYREAIQSPKVQQFIKPGSILTGADGTPYFQWMDPDKGEEALKAAMREKLWNMHKQGLVPENILNIVERPKVEF